MLQRDVTQTERAEERGAAATEKDTEHNADDPTIA